MNETPYEIALRCLSSEAEAARNLADARLILEMIEHIHGCRYAEAQGLFPHLRPIYRNRLGAPPASREEDLAWRDRPPRTGS